MLQGRVKDLAPGATAFPYRGALLNAKLRVAWQNPAHAAACLKWLKGCVLCRIATLLFMRSVLQYRPSRLGTIPAAYLAASICAMCWLRVHKPNPSFQSCNCCLRLVFLLQLTSPFSLAQAHYCHLRYACIFCRITAAAAPYQSNTAYSNYADADLGARSGALYFGNNLARLKVIKKKYDATNLLRFPNSI